MEDATVAQGTDHSLKTQSEVSAFTLRQEVSGLSDGLEFIIVDEPGAIRILSPQHHPLPFILADSKAGYEPGYPQVNGRSMSTNTEQRRVAAVTGAGSGVGRSSALALLADGYSVALLGRRREALEETARRSAGLDRCLVLPMDVTDEEAVVRAFGSVVRRFGRVDVLFNNAGGNVPPIPIEDLSLADWQSVVDVNLNGTFLCAREAVRVMKRQDPRGGRIINNGSVSAQTPRPFSTPYTATKHAITGLTKSVALDGRGSDIACGQIDIGNAATPMTARMAEGVLQADHSLAPEATIDVDHVARAVLYMANLPLDANVLTMTVMATQMPLVGRG